MTLERYHSASPYEPEVGYCRAVRVGDRISVSGTAPIGAGGENVAQGDPEAQARRCFEIADEALAALVAEHEEALVVRTRVYLVDAAYWPAVGRAHGDRFRAAPPACTFVVVAGLLHPDWLVEVEVEAVAADARQLVSAAVST